MQWALTDLERNMRMLPFASGKSLSRTARFAASAILPLLLAFAPASAAADNSRLQKVRDTRLLRVCIWPGYYAISFRNPRNNELQGIDIDLAREFASDLGARLQFVETSFGAFMDDLDEDRCDVAMFAIGDTPARRQRVDMSAPHLRSGMYAITMRSSAVRTWDDLDKPGNVIAVQIGTIMEPYMRANLHNAKLSIVTPPATREEEVLSGRADAFMTDFPYAQRMRFQHDWANVIAPEKPVAETNYGYAVRKGEQAWLAEVDAFVSRIKRDGRLHGAATRHKLEPIVVAD